LGDICSKGVYGNAIQGTLHRFTCVVKKQTDTVAVQSTVPILKRWRSRAGVVQVELTYHGS
jgi:hypothetical protein